MKRNQKRGELIGTRKLTKRSMIAALHEARPVEKGEYLERDNWFYNEIFPKWSTIEPMVREVERHVIVHQQRQVYALVKRLSGKKAADKLARSWTFIRGE